MSKKRLVVYGLLGFLGLFVGLVVIGMLAGSDPPGEAVPQETQAGRAEPTAEPAGAVEQAETVATPRLTASDLPWWDMSAEDYRESNEKINQWATESLGYDLGFHTNQELRANACLIWEQIDYDDNLLGEYGRNVISQGLMTFAEWDEVETVLGNMNGALLNRYMDSYMVARRAGHTSVPPGETLLRAYCALRPVLDMQ